MQHHTRTGRVNPATLLRKSHERMSESTCRKEIGAEEHREGLASRRAYLYSLPTTSARGYPGRLGNPPGIWSRSANGCSTRSCIICRWPTVGAAENACCSWQLFARTPL